MINIFMKERFQRQKRFNAPGLDLPFFRTGLITYLGNKRRLLSFLDKGVRRVQGVLGKKKLRILDGFSGSGCVSRLLKFYSDELYVNDLEDYSATLNECFLANRSELNIDKIKHFIDYLNSNRLILQRPGFIEQNYAPGNDRSIKPGERAFYTGSNARIIDNIRRLIEAKVPERYKVFCLAPLLVEASVHTNTSGVFKGFHKKDGVGHFGGRGENALSRIKQEIELEMPLFSDIECPVKIFKKDINELVRSNELPDLDLAYFDPPYNQHPYGSNYFMLNIINNYKPVKIQDGVSGITDKWNKSDYNKRNKAEKALDNLIRNTRAKFILLSYNDEGIIPIKTLKDILSKHGKWEVMEQDYNTYRGSRNLGSRRIKVKELLWTLKK